MSWLNNRQPYALKALIFSLETLKLEKLQSSTVKATAPLRPSSRARAVYI